METIKSALGFGKKVKYGIVGVGNISQAAFMPGIKHTGNSEIVALVTGDVQKAIDVAEQYAIKQEDVYSYEQYGELIKSGKVDAVYIATPNWQHLDFAGPALRAGIHVLLEKPMEVSSALCQQIIEAQKTTGAKLMIGYRLHCEEGTVTAIERIRSGEIGDVHMFTSIFTQNCSSDNHRAKHGTKGGPFFDMGTYPVNAARSIFGSEPIEVSAVGIRHPEAGFPSDFDDTIAATLRFPDNKVAQFIVSYYGNFVNDYTVVGTKGSIHFSPGYLENAAIEYNPYVVGSKKKHEIFKECDHFGGEAQYFSECILNNTEVEPDGEEGLADVRVLEAVVRAVETKTPQKLEPFKRSKRIEPSQIRKLSPVKPPEPVNVAPPSETF